MSPPVSFARIQRIKGELVPQLAQDLWDNYIMSAVNELQVVPTELKVSRRISSAGSRQSFLR